MNIWQNKHFLIGISGGIAAYKTVELIRRLRERGALVRVMMTEAAHAFITPLTLQAISGHPVHSDLLSTESENSMSHIELARWADHILIAPATANIIAELAHGFANNLLTTVCLATTAPIILAPAMNQQMWQNQATQANIEILKHRDFIFLGPGNGSQACGEIGPGRMIEPHEIISELDTLFFSSSFTEKSLVHKNILITAGPTREALDPVRYFSNRSSGKMGFALAEAAKATGANVTLISGPVNLLTPAQVERINVVTCKEMQEAVLTRISNCDIFISCAAVADYRVADISPEKIASGQTELMIKCLPNPDIFKQVTNQSNPPFAVAFAAQTNDDLNPAQEKRRAKKADMLIANNISRDDIGFDSEQNKVDVLWENQNISWPIMSKKHLAYKLMQLISELYHAKHPN